MMVIVLYLYVSCVLACMFVSTNFNLYDFIDITLLGLVIRFILSLLSQVIRLINCLVSCRAAINIYLSILSMPSYVFSKKTVQNTNIFNL